MRIRKLAVLLKDQSEHIIYIGGAIAPLLQLAPPFHSARATNDIDAIAATTSYWNHVELQKELRRVGFRESVDAGHAHRWIGPDGIVFDLVPAGAHLGATGQEWDEYAIKTAQVAEIGDGIAVRHASAPAFLALKLAAFNDCGRNDPAMSHDLEDIFALVASRPEIASEIASQDATLTAYVAAQLAAIVNRPDFDDLLAGCLGNAFDRAEAARVTRERLAAIAPTAT